MTTTSPQILFGTHYHPGGPDVIHRQTLGQNSLLALNRVKLVNLQFPDRAPFDVQGFETLLNLQNDSQKASGRTGVRKPITNEAFDRLAEKAREYNLPYFGWFNSDIIVTQTVVDYVIKTELEGYILSRMDFAPDTGADRGMFFGGQDGFILGTDWWFKNRNRFRPYVVGEAFWDNLYTPIILCHARSILLNRDGITRHEDHPRVWTNSPFADYNRYMAALDTPYLSIWHKYIEQLRQMRGRNASEAEEMELQKRTFQFKPSIDARIWHVGRCLKAHLRYKLQPSPKRTGK